MNSTDSIQFCTSIPLPCHPETTPQWKGKVCFTLNINISLRKHGGLAFWLYAIRKISSYKKRILCNLFKNIIIILFWNLGSFFAFSVYKLIHSAPSDRPHKLYMKGNSPNKISILEEKSNYLIKILKGPSGRANEMKGNVDAFLGQFQILLYL